MALDLTPPIEEMTMSEHHAQAAEELGMLLDDAIVNGRLAMASNLIRTSTRVLYDEVRAARAGERTWQDIADELGISRQAAFSRFNDHSGR